MNRFLILSAFFAGLVVSGHAQRNRGQGNAFAPPAASLHYAPDRDYDLQNLSVDIDVDYAHLKITGSSTNTLAPLRNGLTVIRLMAGPELKINATSINGQSAPFKREGKMLFITAPGPIKKGEKTVVKVDYVSDNARGQSFGGGGGGWHWIRATTSNPNHVGFWTQGETDSNSNWAPCWDYPNDFTTSQTRITVPADWNVVGNGSLVSNTTSEGGKRRTFVWRMNLPHATYLLSACGGPFDIKTDNWEGVKLYYVVPKGEGWLIDGSFGDTKDMLSFYSKITGVKYAWPKYAQDAMFDFGGGMENVSATTLQESALTEPREGYWNMASLNSHELGHQWFGDFVTCKDWGQIWLNESWATYMQMMYFEHSRGKNGYDEEVENNTNGYLAGARRAKHPLMTRMYSNQDVMFDSSHTYDKGGVILHTLHRFLGDDAFWAGVKLYLTTNAHTPVESWQFCKALTDSSGIDCEPFFQQWIYSPGHPVLDWSSKWDASAKEVVVTVKQTQDTTDGTPVFDIPNASVGLIVDGKVLRSPIHLAGLTTEVRIPSATKPDAVLLDPDHDFLREIPKLPWTDAELVPIFKYAPNCIDRMTAMRRILDAEPDEATIKMVASVLAAEKDVTPAFRSIRQLSALKKPYLRSFYEGLLAHANFAWRAEAVAALGDLPPDPGTTAKLRALITDKDPIQVVINAIHALEAWDKKGNKDVFEKALKIPSHRDRIKSAAQSALED